MATSDSEHFQQLPPLTSEVFTELASGYELFLLLIDYTPSGVGVLFPLRYIHRELIYRTPGQKDAVAFGTATILGFDKYQDVRILFSRPHKTATLRGPSFEGQVKIGRPDNSFSP